MKVDSIFRFLVDLKFNNDRVWFKENEDRYKLAKNNFEQIIDSLLPRIKSMDPSIDVESSKDCVFRIFKDVRFSKDKQPYKTNFGAFMARGGRKGHFGGYYLHFEPDNSFIGGGLYSPTAEVLLASRRHIVQNFEQFKQIVENQKFKSEFGSFTGEKLKMPPKGFDSSFEGIEYLKHKHFAVIKPLDNSFWHRGDYEDQIIGYFNYIKELNNFLNAAID